jgi:putative lipoic acid-binding regulatory protein
LSEHESAAAEKRHEIELIAACYLFPGDFELSVIARNEAAIERAVLDAAVTAAGPPVGHEQKASGGGKYVSHRLRVRCANAEEAQAVRARLREVAGVRTVL